MNNVVEQKAFSVAQVGNYIKQIFEAEEFLHNIRVFGEVSEFKISQGNAWFTIKDSNASLSCSLFGSDYLTFIPKVGESVVVTGTPTFWQKSGKLSFVAKKIEHLGEGELFQKFLELKNKLEKEGLFLESRKKEVPNNAINIGVATSETGAVMHDIIDVATRRNPSVNIFIAPCKVQGSDADTTIINSLKLLDTLKLDVIIIARGGGSREDLDCFNSEKLARYIATLKTPCVSAVGHETDWTICDFVADKRAPTPSASAEIVVADICGYAEKIESLKLQLYSMMNRIVDNYSIIIENKTKFLNASLMTIINNSKMKLEKNKALLKNTITHHFEMKQLKLEYLIKCLKNLNPLNILERGYVQITNDKLNIIKSIEQLEINQNINIILKDGLATGQIISKNKKETKNGI